MEILTTTDYSIFRKLVGNRDCTDSRIEKLRIAHSQDSTVPMIIMVNENMEIVDGQGRFEYLKKSNLPINYIICPGATVETTRILNATPVVWKTKEFVKSNADKGNENYVRIQSLCDKYDCRPQTVIRAANRLDLGGNIKNSLLKTGGFTFSEEDYRKADCKLQKMHLYKTIFRKHRGSNTAKEAAYFFLVEGEYDQKKIEDAEINFGNPSERFDTVLRFTQYLSRVYNYKKPEKSRINFEAEFLKTPNGRQHYYKKG